MDGLYITPNPVHLPSCCVLVTNLHPSTMAQQVNVICGNIEKEYGTKNDCDLRSQFDLFNSNKVGILLIHVQVRIAFGRVKSVMI